MTSTRDAQWATVERDGHEFTGKRARSVLEAASQEEFEKLARDDPQWRMSAVPRKSAEPGVGKLFSITNVAQKRTLGAYAGKVLPDTYSRALLHVVDDSGDEEVWWISLPVLPMRFDGYDLTVGTLDSDYRNNRDFLWAIEPAGDGYYYLRHFQTGRYLNDHGFDVFYLGDKGENGKWRLDLISSTPAIADLPRQADMPRFKSPRLDSCDPIDDYTPPKWHFVGWVCLHPYLVKYSSSPMSIDNVVLKRYSRWRKIDWRIRDGGKEESRTMTVTFGIEKSASTTVEQSVNLAVTAEAGFALKGVTASMSTSIETGLRVATEISDKTSYTREESVTVKYVAASDGRDRASATWVREDRYVLLNHGGVEIIPPWVVTANDRAERSYVCE